MAIKTTNSKAAKHLDRIWFFLLLLCIGVLVYLMQMSRLHSSSEATITDHRQHPHLKDFVRGSSSITTKGANDYGNSLHQQDPRKTGGPTVLFDPQYWDSTGNIRRNHDPNLIDPFYANVRSDGTNLWDDDPDIPEWLKTYWNWHKQKRQSWNLQNWTSERWIVMQCLVGHDDRHCGGTADRLKPVPLLLRFAYESRRILLIYWSRPAPLEEFLVPPAGGMDWRIPRDMALVMQNETNGRRFVPSKIISNYSYGNLSLVRTRYQSYAGGAQVYDNCLLPGEKRFSDVFAAIWRIMFRPSPGVAQVIETQLARMGYVPGGYVAAHLRALYNTDKQPLAKIESWTKNAVNCASTLKPGYPIFFASDSSDATEAARKYGQARGTLISSHTPMHNPPFHIDKHRGRSPFKAVDYYDTFVDLYLMALAGCVTYNKGGFGTWGLLMGGNSSCGINQKYVDCTWTEPTGPIVLPAKRDKIFLDPMP